MTKIYELWKYQEHGFASSSTKIATYKNKEDARKKVKELNETNDNAIYDIYEEELL